MKKAIYSLLKFQLILYTFFTLSTAYAQSNWFWLQPLPTGAALNSVDFINKNTGYTCGKAGVVTKTTNGGTNWILLNTGTEIDLSDIKCLDANTCIVAGASGLIMKTTNGGINWVTIPSGTTNLLNEISFPTNNTGYIVGFGGLVYKSTNSGNNWTLTQSGLSATLYSVSFLDVNRGVAGGFNTVFTTTNGGTDWITHALGSFFDVFQTVNYINDSSIFALQATDDLVFKSTNNGSSWTSYSINFTKLDDIGRCMSFKNVSTGYIVTSFGDIVKTTNEGLNWSLDTTFAPNFSLSQLFFSVTTIDTNYAFAVGSGGLTVRTTNSGQRWEKLIGNLQTYNDVFFTDDNTGYSVGEKGVLIKTTDAGLSWNKINLNTTFDLKKLYFTSLNTGYICGDTGLILKTTNAGLNWFNQISPSLDTNLLSIHFINENTGFIGVFYRTILKTTNSGLNWLRVYTVPGFDIAVLQDFDFLNSNKGIACAENGFLFTTNGGNDWTKVVQSGVSFTTVNYLDSLNIIAAGLVGRIFKSTNGGLNWFSINNPFGADINSSQFFGSNFGVMCGDLGKIGRTTNGGINWIIQERIASEELFSIYLVNPNTGYSVGQYGQIIKTTNGGLSFINSSQTLNVGNYYLFQNFPNPFNPKTIINYQCSMFNYVLLKVYDILGNEVTILVNQNQKAGNYSVEFDGTNLSSGIYFYSLFSDNILIDTKKCLLIK